MLTLNKKDLLKTIRSLYIAGMDDHLKLIRLSDGSFLVGFASDIPSDPNLLIGCIGQWVNTDSLEWAEDVFNGILKLKEATKVEHSVTASLIWRKALEKLCPNYR